MKVQIIDNQGKKSSEMELPIQFKEAIRTDLVKRAVAVVLKNKRQPYGADPMAGKKASAELSRRRRKYRGSYGLGISRVPRKILSRRGTRMTWVGAFAPGTVGGRRAHAPKASKILTVKINTKERRKAIRSALSATVQKELVTARGHLIPEAYPFVLDSAVEKLAKSKDFSGMLKAIGFEDELKKASVLRIRAGKGKIRGRKYKKNRGILVVVSNDCPLTKAASNLAGVELVKVNELNAEVLAPGAKVGRATLFTKAAVDAIAQNKMFMNGKVKVSQ